MRSPPEAIGKSIYDWQYSGIALPDGDLKVIRLLPKGYLVGVEGDCT